jgi:hypothetical protein
LRRNSLKVGLLVGIVLEVELEELVVGLVTLLAIVNY